MIRWRRYAKIHPQRDFQSLRPSENSEIRGHTGVYPRNRIFIARRLPQEWKDTVTILLVLSYNETTKDIKI
jgi:hypothetical protein